MRDIVLSIDDEESIREMLSEGLGDTYELVTAPDAKEGLASVERYLPSMVLLDIKMPGKSGLALLEELKKTFPAIPVIMITALADVSFAVQAIKIGAEDYIVKPFDIDKLKVNIGNILERIRLKEENEALRREVVTRYDFHNIIGVSPQMQKVYQLIEKVLDNNITVLIRGESGTGKELIARAIHFNSLRKDRPFITVNCAAIPDTLLESELFGHEKGAFTGALRRKNGKFEMANTGTIFLDEIGTMKPEMQAKMLRVLQEKEIERIGGTQTIKVDVRIMAATNSNLEEAVKCGSFREDLYYRLNVMSIEILPLRERKEDIPVLAEYFIGKFSKVMKRDPKKLSPEVIDLFMRYSWPGNVRELENIIESFMVMVDDSSIKAEHLPARMRGEKPEDFSLMLKDDDMSLEKLEEILITSTLKKNGWNISKASLKLGITRKTLRTKIVKYGIDKKNNVPAS